METTLASGSNSNVVCDQRNGHYMLTSDLDMIASVTVLLAVISTFTVFANLIIIISITKAYIYGIYITDSRCQNSSLTSSKAMTFCRSYLMSCTDKASECDKVVRTPAASTRNSSPPASNRATADCANALYLTQPRTLRQDANTAIVSGLPTGLATEIKYPTAVLIPASDKTRTLEINPDMLTATAQSAPTTAATCEASVAMLKEISKDTKTISSPPLNQPEKNTKGDGITNEKHTGVHTGRKFTGPPPSGRTIRLRSDSTNIPIVLMFSMAISDVLLGAVIMPLSTLEIMHNGTWPLCSTCCKLRASLDVILSTTSIYHVTCMAADRYLAICRPFLHRKLSVRAGVLAAVVCWVLPVGMVTFLQILHLFSVEETPDSAGSCEMPESINSNDSLGSKTDIDLIQNAGS
ncbi:5-hydroxytryptamine receptor 4-like, partial [Elysia marginata]